MRADGVQRVAVDLGMFDKMGPRRGREGCEDGWMQRQHTEGERRPGRRALPRQQGAGGEALAAAVLVCTLVSGTPNGPCRRAAPPPARAARRAHAARTSRWKSDVCSSDDVSSRHHCPAATSELTLAPHSVSASRLSHCAANASALATSSTSVQRRSGEPKSSAPRSRRGLGWCMVAWLGRRSVGACCGEDQNAARLRPSAAPCMRATRGAAADQSPRPRPWALSHTPRRLLGAPRGLPVL